MQFTWGLRLPGKVLRATFMNTWETPSFIEVNMSAEIGGYQGDEDPRPEHTPDFVDSTLLRATPHRFHAYETRDVGRCVRSC